MDDLKKRGAEFHMNTEAQQYIGSRSDRQGQIRVDSCLI